MPPLPRHLQRDVFIWDLNNNDDRIPLGGMKCMPGTTHKDFRQMLDILVITSADVVVYNSDGDEVLRDDTPLSSGDYTVSADEVCVADEPVYTRAASITTGIRTKSFTDAVRARDGGCVVSKVMNPDIEIGEWLRFQAAHIFPLAYESQWKDGNYDRWITIDPPQGGKINSVQNGILLRSDVHLEWDTYRVSINPDNGYKIIYFGSDINGCAGNVLDQRLLEDPRCPPADLFRWHFRQAVLTNMRGEGEPLLELDFPPNSDMLGQILEAPKAAERLEFEFFDRLAHHVDIT
ncbi:hypothetical protein F503_06589 [Ophiostoma piceae UAMH 11346]|uniref:Uncharacterized protein n=1 Tax=Ophiostoma piceae (strain UAMH 11346) TaxID=1262450 RepID=S3C8S8_OPHP1|nr:hypothetical protein F503_06589 [Ophiostoma piceae UAMH 11346]